MGDMLVTALYSIKERLEKKKLIYIKIKKFLKQRKRAQFHFKTTMTKDYATLFTMK